MSFPLTSCPKGHERASQRFLEAVGSCGASTDAGGNTFWSARDLMPLMGYNGVNSWQWFYGNAIKRAEQAANNVGLTCQFMRSHKVVSRPQGGTVERADVHLDRMAAYLVAMNGDPNKPEVAHYPRQLPPPFGKRPNVQPCSPSSCTMHQYCRFTL